MERRISQTAKAVKERNYRSTIYSERQFNNPLREFIERKYNNIYQEYVELFNLLKSKHPNRKNLAKTKTFRKWKAENPPPEQSTQHNVLTIALREAEIEDADQIPACQNVEIPENVTESPHQNRCEIPQENIEDAEDPDEITPERPGEIPDENNEAADIINELLENRDMRNILGETEDEGIELSIFDDIEFDIEPFDFNVEVEEYDY